MESKEDKELCEYSQIIEDLKQSVPIEIVFKVRSDKQYFALVTCRTFPGVEAAGMTTAIVTDKEEDVRNVVFNTLAAVMFMEFYAEEEAKDNEKY